MARRVFFSFHYQNDIFRVSQIRNSGITKGTYEQSGFIDHADWESIERSGDKAIQRWIDSQLDGASVTVVLIGSETYGREWVNYEIKKSHEDGKGLIGIRIHKLKDPRTGQTSSAGKNPFAYFHFTGTNPPKYLSEVVPVYDWIDDDGYTNFAKWVEKAAKTAGR